MWFAGQYFAKQCSYIIRGPGEHTKVRRVLPFSWNSCGPFSLATTHVCIPFEKMDNPIYNRHVTIADIRRGLKTETLHCFLFAVLAGNKVRAHVFGNPSSEIHTSQDLERPCWSCEWQQNIPFSALLHPSPFFFDIAVVTDRPAMCMQKSITSHVSNFRRSSVSASPSQDWPARLFSRLSHW